MTPVQYLLFLRMGLSVDMAIKLSFGTSLMVILPTAASGTWRHHREQAVKWRTALVMGGVGLGCAYGGAALATYMPGETLKIAFGVAVLAAAVRMLAMKPPDDNTKPQQDPRIWAAWAVPIGFLGGLLGIGGGMLAVPILVMALHFKMHDAIATSLTIVMITSIGGIIGYIVNGMGVPGLPLHSLGYVHLETWGLLTSTSIAMAPLGAKMAHRLPANRLKIVFVGVLFYMGLKMIGVVG